MTKEEARDNIRYKSILFHDDGTIVTVSSYIDSKSDLRNKKEFNEKDQIGVDQDLIYPNVRDEEKGFSTKHYCIQLTEFNKWHLATIENLQINPLAYCNFLAMKQDKIFRLLETARLYFPEF